MDIINQYINKYINKLKNDFKNQKYYERIYTLSLYFVYVLYIISFLFNKKYDKYISYIRLFLKYYVILFLIIKFNPFTRSKCSSFDKFIIFQSAIFLLLTTNIITII